MKKAIKKTAKKSTPSKAWEAILARKKALRERYVSVVPQKMKPGRIIIHNHILPAIGLGTRGFRAWTANAKFPNGKPSGYVKCNCGIWPQLPEHYKVVGAGAWTKQKIIAAFKKKEFKAEGCPVGVNPHDIPGYGPGWPWE